jgi:predicted DsbA family dithiol-disulfide isomerase
VPEVVRFVAYSDYLCPWCWNASRRLERLAEEYRGRIEILWRSYLLRPKEKLDRDREKFRRYTQSWAAPAAEEDAGEFRVWSSDDPPPTHSIPAHRVAKAAARMGPEAFRMMHERLMTAYFAENRDISSFDVLRELWLGEGFGPAEFEVTFLDEVEAQILREHEEAQEWGAHGVPAIRRIDNDAVIVGAHPEQLYRRWIDRSLARREGLVEAGSLEADLLRR